MREDLRRKKEFDIVIMRAGLYKRMPMGLVIESV
jgi:hypothetical protein